MLKRTLVLSIASAALILVGAGCSSSASVGGDSGPSINTGGSANY